MNWRILILFSLVISVVGAIIITSISDDQHQKYPSASNLQDTQKNHDENSGHSSIDDMEGMDMSGTEDEKNSNMSDDIEGMEEDSHRPVKEQPANAKVLGTFGAINLILVVIGIWNKWFRRKVGSK